MSELHQRIITESRRLFRMHGLRTVTMDDIAASLRISKRTLYEHFSDKDHLVQACLLEQIEDQNSQFAEFFREPPDILTAILRCYRFISDELKRTNISYFKELRRYHPAVYEEVMTVHHKEAFRTLVRLICKGQREGLFMPSVNPRLVALLFHHRNDVLSSPEHHSFLLEEFSLSDILEVLIVHTLRGIATPAGIDIIDRYLQQNPNGRQNRVSGQDDES